MSATTAGAIKALIEGAGLGLSVYRDGAPSTPDPTTGQPVVAVPLPYVSVRERIALTPDRDGAYDRDVPHTVREAVQVDLWQRWRTDDGKVAEDYTLADRLARVLHGAALPSAPTRVYGVAVTARVRLLEPGPSIVHDVLTVTVNREQ